MQNNDENNINYEYITRYIRNTMPKRTGILAEMEKYAKENSVPIAQPETIGLIENMLLFKKAERVLEIGAAIGYSTVIMASTGADVVTVESDEKMIEMFENFVGRSGFDGRITLFKGDATVCLNDIDGEYDFIFVDAAKGQYLNYLPHCMRLLKKGGILFSDNILYKGMVATDELYQRRKITIIKRLRKYLDTICNTEELKTVIVPVGDGAAISYKLK